MTALFGVCDMEKYICCFCGETFYDYGNNPAPADDTPGARCCDNCNSSIVIPARVEAYLQARANKQPLDKEG